MTRRIVYITGTRADYGLMRRTLLAIDTRPDLSLALVVTGMHLDPVYGHTVREIEADGLEIAARVPIAPGDGGATMARGIATMIAGFVDAFEQASPDIVLLLGDRGEMLAGAIAAGHLGIAVAHIHGGERSGTIDEPVRHAISKLSHVHLAATNQSHERLVRMGEDASRVSTVGAPGLVGLADEPDQGRMALAVSAGFDPAQPIVLLIYHPVHSETGTAAADIAIVVDELEAARVQVVAVMPNSDSGGMAIRTVLADRGANADWLSVHKHLSRPRFVAWMAAVDAMIGNSSAGIIEAATFGTPVINIGERQQMRERNRNVTDVPLEPFAIRVALERALSGGRHTPDNVYGDGATDTRVAALLSNVRLDRKLLAKCNAY